MDIHVLTVAGLGGVVGDVSIAPVERNDRAVGVGAKAALVEDRVRVVLEAAGVGAGRHPITGRRVGRRMVGLVRVPLHPFGEALAEALLDGLEAYAHIVHTVHHDAGTHMLAGDVNKFGQRTAAEYGGTPAEEARLLGVVLHGQSSDGERLRVNTV